MHQGSLLLKMFYNWKNAGDTRKNGGSPTLLPTNEMTALGGTCIGNIER